MSVHQDPSKPGLELQQELCSPAKQLELQSAGGPCAGFVHFCAVPFQAGGPYCSTKAFESPAGSPDWLSYHQVRIGVENAAVALTPSTPISISPSW